MVYHSKEWRKTGQTDQFLYEKQMNDTKVNLLDPECFLELYEFEKKVKSLPYWKDLCLSDSKIGSCSSQAFVSPVQLIASQIKNVLVEKATKEDIKKAFQTVYKNKLLWNKNKHLFGNE